MPSILLINPVGIIANRFLMALTFKRPFPAFLPGVHLRRFIPDISPERYLVSMTIDDYSPRMTIDDYFPANPSRMNPRVDSRHFPWALLREHDLRRLPGKHDLKGSFPDCQLDHDHDDYFARMTSRVDSKAFSSSMTFDDYFACMNLHRNLVRMTINDLPQA